MLPAPRWLHDIAYTTLTMKTLIRFLTFGTLCSFASLLTAAPITRYQVENLALPDKAAQAQYVVSGKVVALGLAETDGNMNNVVGYIEVDEVLKGEPTLEGISLGPLQTSAVRFTYNVPTRPSRYDFNRNVGDNGIWFFFRADPMSPAAGMLVVRERSELLNFVRETLGPQSAVRPSVRPSPQAADPEPEAEPEVVEATEAVAAEEVAAEVAEEAATEAEEPAGEMAAEDDGGASLDPVPEPVTEAGTEPLDEADASDDEEETADDDEPSTEG